MKNVLLILMAFTLVACNNDDDNTDPAVQTGPILFTTIDKSHLRGSGDQGIQESNLIIDNTIDWNNLMVQMDLPPYGPHTNNFTQTTIDFNQYIIIAVFRDVFPHFETVEITSVMENVNDIEITTVDSNFNSGFLATSQPYHIVMIPKTTKPIVFL